MIDFGRHVNALSALAVFRCDAGLDEPEYNEEETNSFDGIRHGDTLDYLLLVTNYRLLIKNISLRDRLGIRSGQMYGIQSSRVLLVQIPKQ